MVKLTRSAISIWTLVLALLLVGCGANPTTTSTPAGRTASAPPAAPPANSPAAATATSSTPAAATGTSAAAPSAAATAAPSAAPNAASGKYASIPQSKTAEGYYVLGDGAAPIVMMHYSDFL